MTKGMLFSQILIELGYDSQDRRAHPLSVFLAADTVRGELIPPFVYGTPQNNFRDAAGEESLAQFCVAKVLPVQFDTARGRKYVQLPWQILGLTDNAGLVQVSLTQEEEGSFVAVGNGMLSVYSNLEAGGAAGKTLYWLEGTRIYFRELPAYVEEVLTKTIPSIYDLQDDDIIPQPLEFNAMVIKGTRARLQEQKVTPQDGNNDNRSGV